MEGKWTGRTALLLAVLVPLAAAWFLVGAVPSHWMRHIDFGTVKVDDLQVRADIYFANPTGEAEAVALVHVKDAGDYFLDFGSEKVRQASPSEFLHLFGGIWSYRSLPQGAFREPLPSPNLNEFRIPTQDGHAVSVQF